MNVAVGFNPRRGSAEVHESRSDADPANTSRRRLRSSLRDWSIISIDFRGFKHQATIGSRYAAKTNFGKLLRLPKPSRPATHFSFFV